MTDWERLYSILTDQQNILLCKCCSLSLFHIYVLICTNTQLHINDYFFILIMRLMMMKKDELARMNVLDVKLKWTKKVGSVKQTSQGELRETKKRSSRVIANFDQQQTLYSSSAVVVSVLCTFSCSSGASPVPVNEQRKTQSIMPIKTQATITIIIILIIIIILCKTKRSHRVDDGQGIIFYCLWHFILILRYDRPVKV